MRELLPLVAEVIGEAVAEAILLVPNAWLISLLTEALNSSGLDQIPALSFWQSVGILVLISLLAIQLRAGMSNKEDKGER